MSPKEAPAPATEEKEANPVGTQDSSDAGKKEDLNQAVEKAVTDMFTVKTDAWKPRVLVKFKIDCPSGQTALVKHLDTLDLLEYDLIEELDFFTRKLFPLNIDASGNPVEAQEQIEETIWGALKNPEKRCRFLDMTGKLMAAASIRPHIIHDGVAVVPVQGSDTEKTTKFGYEMSAKEQAEVLEKPVPRLGDNEVYSGYIDFADRMAFFQELNRPLSMIEPFREESTAVLQDLAREQSDGSEAE